MGMVRVLFMWCILIFASALCLDISDDDSIIVEAADSRRTNRQLFLGSPLYAAIQAPAFAASPCLTSQAVLGRCMSFTQCYPNFKLLAGNDWNSWALGLQDPCSYYTAQGRQMIGICCANPQKPSSEENESAKKPSALNEDTNESEPATANSPKNPNYPSWPPPIPTHPPDHTIPPLPTHPPSPGYPTLPTQPTVGKPSWPPAWPPTTSKPSWPPSTSKPSWPPSTSKPSWPPTTNRPKPTKPSKPPVTSAPAADTSCGTKNGYQDQERIVGGHNADLGEWPWIAALFNNGRQFCGGSLINNINILTAAHCVAHMSSWDVAGLTVRLGDHNIRTNSEVRHLEKKVKRVVRHRGFDPRTLYNDIAVLTLDSPVQFSKQIRPICLPSGRSNYAGQTATVIGWGSLRESGPQPSVLQEVNIPVWSNGECRNKYGPAAPGGIVEHMLCAGQANRDSCSGDSGGPLMVNSGKWVQAGIVSWGIGCGKGQYPGVYTRVEHFMPWINKNLK